MIFDPSYPEIDMSVFKVCDWREFYGDFSEPIPPSAPQEDAGNWWKVEFSGKFEHRLQI
jgi:hypothetical protein